MNENAPSLMRGGEGTWNKKMRRGRVKQAWLFQHSNEGREANRKQTVKNFILIRRTLKWGGVKCEGHRSMGVNRMSKFVKAGRPLKRRLQ